MKPAATWQTDYQNSSGKAQTNWLAGIQQTQKDWAALTTAAIPRMVSGFNTAAGNGTIATGIARGGTQNWRTKAEQKQAAFGTGITNGAAAYGVAAGKLYAFYQSAIPGLPARGDITQNLNRANQLALLAHQNKGQFKGK